MAERPARRSRWTATVLAAPGAAAVFGAAAAWSLHTAPATQVKPPAPGPVNAPGAATNPDAVSALQASAAANEAQVTQLNQLVTQLREQLKSLNTSSHGITPGAASGAVGGPATAAGSATTPVQTPAAAAPRRRRPAPAAVPPPPPPAAASGANDDRGIRLSQRPLLGSLGDVTTAGLSVSFAAMASTVTIQLAAESTSPHDAIERVRGVFREVERQCTRFDPRSPLMQANAAANAWHVVPQYCYAALAAAARAHQATDTTFDPRVLRALLRLGYDRSLPFGAGDVEIRGRSVPVPQHRASERWWPAFDAARSAVRIGPVPVDLGGIAKGLAIRWAAEAITDVCESYLIEAGGDCYLAGNGPDGAGWQVGVEDPRGGTEPMAVLNLRSTGCATSSTRLRHWTVAGQRVHHLIDPRTGTPGGRGLLAVTVVGVDPAMDEVWSKVLFLSGRDDIEAQASAHCLAALWITDDGAVGMSEHIAPAVIWQAS